MDKTSWTYSKYFFMINLGHNCTVLMYVNIYRLDRINSGLTPKLNITFYVFKLMNSSGNNILLLL